MELLGFPPSLPSPTGIKVGDKVRVKSTITTPRYKWGYVTHESVGIVTCKILDILNILLIYTNKLF